MEVIMPVFFSGISATGAVKNLILGQAVYNKENDTKNAAFLAGINRGEINNCILQNCTVESSGMTAISET